MSTASASSPAGLRRRAIRVGSVSFLNAKPLIFGLDHTRDVKLALDVPSRLIDGLRGHEFDMALLPVIDYQRMAGLRVVTSGGIGCDGPTLTVRIFSRVPISEIQWLACDTDSHTSVALARVILAERFGLRPQFVDLKRGIDQPCEARLLIGDKVVCEEPSGFEHQLDLGLAWKQMTGLPFVFAAWMVRDGVDLGDLPQRLERAKRQGLKHVDEIIAQHAVPRGWPPGVALQYLTCYLTYDIGERQLKAIQQFHALAERYGLVESPVRALRIYG